MQYIMHLYGKIPRKNRGAAWRHHRLLKNEAYSAADKGSVLNFV